MKKRLVISLTILFVIAGLFFLNYKFFLTCQHDYGDSVLGEAVQWNGRLETYLQTKKMRAKDFEELILFATKGSVLTDADLHASPLYYSSQFNAEKSAIKIFFKNSHESNEINFNFWCVLQIKESTKNVVSKVFQSQDFPKEDWRHPQIIAMFCKYPEQKLWNPQIIKLDRGLTEMEALKLFSE